MAGILVTDHDKKAKTSMFPYTIMYGYTAHRSLINSEPTQ